MSAHSTLGPSGAKRWISCPGSIKLSENAPRRPTSYEAAEGQVAHKLAERFLNDDLDVMGMMGEVDKIVKQEGHDVKITDEMVDGAVLYKATIDADSAALASMGSPGVKVRDATEVKVHAKSVDDRCWGTADKLLYKKGAKLIVYDYKFGKGVVVEPKENEQASLYAIGALEAAEIGNAFNEVELVIIQPRAPHPEGPVRRWNVPKDWLKAFLKRAKEAAAKTLEDDAPVVAGTWCRWCPVEATCPVNHQKTQDRAMMVFSEVPPEIPGKNDVERAQGMMAKVRLLPVNKLVKVLEWENNIDSFVEAVRDTLFERLSAGEEIPGVKLVSGRSNRVYTSEAEVIEKFKPKLGESLWEKKLLSPAKLEAVVGKKAGVDALTYKPEARKTVALASDPRPAVKSRAQDVFSEVTGALDAECPECDLMGASGCSRHKEAAAQGQRKIWA